MHLGRFRNPKKLVIVSEKNFIVQDISSEYDGIEYEWNKEEDYKD